MKAIELYKYGNPEEAFRFKKYEIPTPKSEEVLIKVEASGLNFADIMSRRGLYKDAPPIPFIPGYEVVGVIEKVGENVHESWKGKRVVGFTRFGGYAEYVTTIHEGIAEIPEEAKSGAAAALATQYCTAYFSAFLAGHLMEGQNVIIHSAAGGVGTALIQLCKWMNCNIIGLTTSEHKLKHLKNLGVDHPTLADDHTNKAKSVFGNKKVDLSFNSTAGKSIPKEFKQLSPGGSIILFGASDRAGKKGGLFATIAFAFKTGIFHPVQLIMNSNGIIGVNMLHIADAKPFLLNHCINKVVELYNKNILTPEVGGEFNANDIDKAHEFVETKQSKGKVIIKWE
ncbi:MAG: zinc-binding alcohol dehydrogenase family protein [Flavobacteriales bacterium]